MTGLARLLHRVLHTPHTVRYRLVKREGEEARGADVCVHACEYGEETRIIIWSLVHFVLVYVGVQGTSSSRKTEKPEAAVRTCTPQGRTGRHGRTESRARR